MSGFITPLLGLIKYLDEIHIRHCPPDDVASGVSSLPLGYVYLDGSPDKTNVTTKKLPLTNGTLDGKELYKRIVPRFTTTNISPEMIFAEGEKQLNIFYAQVSFRLNSLSSLFTLQFLCSLEGFFYYFYIFYIPPLSQVYKHPRGDKPDLYCCDEKTGQLTSFCHVS